MTSLSLAAALDALVAIAARHGLDVRQARAEGEGLAAAVAEPAVGAYLDWAREVGRPAGAADFFTASSAGRRWRVAPTPLLSALAREDGTAAADYADALGAVCQAAVTLGAPSKAVADIALDAAAAQRLALGSPPNTAGTSTYAPQVNPFDPAAAMGDVLAQLQINAERIEALRGGFDGTLMRGFDGAQPTGGFDRAQPTGGFDGVRPAGSPVPELVEGTPNDPVAQAAQEPSEEAPAEVEPEGPSLEELLAELDGLTGLSRVKEEIHQQTAVLRVESLRQKAGLKVATITRHLVFVGNPGTGKTTVARLVGGIYKALGLLSKGQLVEVDRSELVAGFLGQTAIKTAEVCKSAIGGVLFIDEAYGLSGDQYGEEAINTLVKEMEDNRSDLVVIVAGYPLPMAGFIAQNPGLASRFRTTIMFDDYADDELEQIFSGMVTKADYVLADGALDAFRAELAQQMRDETFGNGRFARNVLEAAIGRQAWRLRDVEDPSVDELKTLTADDIHFLSDTVDIVEPKDATSHEIEGEEPS